VRPAFALDEFSFQAHLNMENSMERQWNERSSAKNPGMGDAESMFRMLFERSADAILLLDPQRNVFVDCNAAAVEMMRARSKEQLLLTHPADVSPELQPDGRSSRDKTPEMTAATLANGSHRFEWLCRRFDGVEFYVEVLCTLVQTGEHPLVAAVCRDITDRKAAEAALRESEARFRALFERSADAMCLFDPESGRIIETNEAVARLVGAAPHEVLGKSSTVNFSPERQPDGRLSMEKAAEMVKLAVANGSHRFEWISRRRDGTELPLDIVLTALSFGQRPLLLVISRDVSAQKKAEQEILRLNGLLEQRVSERTVELVQANEQLTAEVSERRRQEKTQHKRNGQMQRHRDVLLELAQSRKADFEQALETICSLAAATLDVARVSYWSFVDNNSAIVCDLLHFRDGHSAGERLKGSRVAVSDCPAYFAGLAAKRPMAADDVFSHPATIGLAESYLKPRGINSMLDAPVWVRGEMVGVLCHEHVGPPREWSVEEVDFVSGLAAMVSLALEESYRADSERRLRESEGRFSAAFRGSPVFITISDFAEGRYILANEAFLKWSGYRLEEVLGRNSAELELWAEPSERVPFWEELRRTRSIRERECRIRGRHGEVFTALLSADLIEISGKPHLLTVGLDITQRKQVEAELLKTVTREKELGLLRSKFVSMVSHEFRTPLGIIQSSAEILDDYLERLGPDERKEHLRSIQKNTRRMAALMEEVLLIGGLDSGKMDFKPAPVDVVRFVGRLVDEVLSATDRRCPIRLTLDEIPGPAHADERLLRHIFTNLLTNAVKYSEAGRAVEFEISGDGADAVCVVRDSGIGIPDADREWLFSPFHRGQNVGERPGTGLGLVIVKRCADAHGGRIQVDSMLGEGTTVIVRLPVFGQILREDRILATAAQPVTGL
jgi:PAS domain S-box-containing protein